MLALSDELEFAAIQAIHHHMDDNEDGKVDVSESEEVCVCVCNIMWIEVGDSPLPAQNINAMCSL